MTKATGVSCVSIGACATSLLYHDHSATRQQMERGWQPVARFKQPRCCLVAAVLEHIETSLLHLEARPVDCHVAPLVSAVDGRYVPLAVALARHDHVVARITGDQLGVLPDTGQSR